MSRFRRIGKSTGAGNALGGLVGLAGFALTAQAADQRWSDAFSIQSGCEDAVWVVEPGPEQSLFVGGDFDGCDGVDANHVIQYHPATGEWTRLGTQAQNGVSNSSGGSPSVRALAWDGERLFVGGFFDQAGGLAAASLAAWEPGGSGWSTVGNGVDGAVFDLVILEDWLYVGGNFSSLDNEAPISASNLARWDRASGGWSQPGSGVDNIVRALLVDGNDLYAGGNFTLADPDAASPVAANHIARFDGENWHALGSGAGNGTDSAVLALTLSPAGVYVGGFFESVNLGDDLSANRVALWDGDTWQALVDGGGNGVNSAVETLLYDDGRLYLGGRFNTLAVGAPEPIYSPRLAYWEAGTWFGLVENVDFSWGGLGPRSMALVGEDLFIGGAFGRVTEPGGERVPAFGLTRFDGERFHPVGTGLGASFEILSIVEFQGQLHAAGWFEEIGGIPASRIARFDGQAWHALGNGGGEGFDDVVETLAVHDGALYAGGRFTQANPDSPAALSVNRIARWDGSQWSAVGANGGQGVNDRVLALLSTADGLVVGGEFTSVNTGNAITARRIARVANNQWSAIEGSGGEGLDDRVLALLEHDGALYAAGTFSAANIGNPIPTEMIARHAGGEWSALPGGPTSSFGRAEAMAIGGGGLYVAGLFSEIDAAAPQSAPGIARWDLAGESWAPLENAAGDTVGLSGGRPLALAWQDGLLYAAGIFTSTTGPGFFSLSRVGRWDGEQWTSLGSGLERALSSSNPQLAVGRDLLASDPDTLWVTGNFRRAGGRSSHYIGRYALRGTLAVEITGNGTGTVSSQPAGIDCPGDCSLTQPWDQPLELAAVPGTGSSFAGFSGGGCTSSPCSLPFDQSTTVSAQFDLNSYIVTTLASNGTITSQLDPVVDHGQAITVTGQAGPGHHFTTVSGCGGTTQTNTDQSVTDFSYTTGAIIDECTVEAEFDINNYDLDVSVIGQGSVTPVGQTVDHGDSANWTVAPASDWSVFSFTGDTCVPANNLDGTWTAGGIEAACDLTTEFRPDSTTTVQTSNNPAVVGLPVTYSIEVTGIDSLPVGGQAVVIASTNEACASETPDVSGPQSVVFTCQITYAGTGQRTIEASYIDSDTHMGSDAPALTQTVAGSEFLFQDRFEN